MIAEMWENEDNARELLRLFPDSFSRRKLRHFICEFVRGKFPLPLRIEAATVLALAGQISDDEANVDEGDWVVTFEELDARAGTSFAGGNAFLLVLAIGVDIYDDALWALEDVTVPENEQAVTLIREIFGNPFRPIDFAPWRTDTAVSLARDMYESRDFSAMPIVADALQDAGCDNAEVLNHCRDATSRSRVLGRGWRVGVGVGAACRRGTASQLERLQ